MSIFGRNPYGVIQVEMLNMMVAYDIHMSQIYKFWLIL